MDPPPPAHLQKQSGVNQGRDRPPGGPAVELPEVDECIEDLHQLAPERYEAVTQLIRNVSLFVADHFQPTKLNVACIGNMVRQMHIHIVGRSEGDPAWPGTVWASDAKQPYPPESIAAIRDDARLALDLD